MKLSGACEGLSTHVRAVIATLVATASALGGSHAANAQQNVDLLIRGGQVIDGTGAQPRRADVGVTGERISFVGDAAEHGIAARRTIDATGLIVTPGFIDPHTHSGGDLRAPDAKRRAALNHIMQGVTTVFIGNDGGGGPNIARELQTLRALHTGVNVASFIGFGAVRRHVLGEVDRAPSPAETTEMRALVAKGMCDGAVGFSTGLYYAPQSFASMGEVIALAKEAARLGGVYETHLREEGSGGIGLFAALEEALTIGREAGLPVHLAHIKTLGADTHGRAGEVVARIEAARRQGLRVTADQYPWAASGSRLTNALAPRWAMDGGREALLERFNDPTLRARLIADMNENLRRRNGAEAILLSGGAYKGQRLAAIASLWRVPPIEAAVRIIREEGDATIASFNMAERDIEAFARQPWVVASSDASNGHPRRYGSFAERWSRFVRNERILSAPEFVHRASGLTAEIFGLVDRGTLRVGSFADVAMFDASRFASRATYEDPEQLATGMTAVLVNGQLAVEDAKPTRALAGHVLSKPRNAACES